MKSKEEIKAYKKNGLNVRIFMPSATELQRKCSDIKIKEDIIETARLFSGNTGTNNRHQK